MAKKPNNPKPETDRPALRVKDVPHAPILYFDGAPNFGHNEGVITITLAASRYLLDGDEIAYDIVAVAHLRCVPEAARNLRNAIDSALLLSMPAEGKSN